ncbi:MAG: GNAT family N-acetyltransferase [Gemmatimonadetes bacterium]|nr:GNAT family N-acetyltransferase [Gemmatimonadota bacterium]
MLMDHVEGLAAAAAQGEQWRLFFTFVPEPDGASDYVSEALRGQTEGRFLPWVVRELGSGELVGSSRFHDIVPAIRRVEIGYTWYTPRWQRTHVNTACKLLMLRHAFQVVGCDVVGLRTDGLNHRSQAAIEGLGAKKDGVVRHYGMRRDGSARDEVMYSILRSEWPGVEKHLETRLWRYGASSSGPSP